jgi:hypothetical protein
MPLHATRKPNPKNRYIPQVHATQEMRQAIDDKVIELNTTIADYITTLVDADLRLNLTAKAKQNDMALVEYIRNMTKA